jgi:putative colanic acid biosynthesis UDP-glucose lipid carrier transferase
MISQRIRGIQNLLVLFQCAAASALFWALFLGLWHFYAEMSGAFTERYLQYWFAVIAGLVVELITRDTTRFRHNVVQADFARQHRVSLRQTLIATTAMLLFIAFRKDTYISRFFLAAFAPSLYVVLFTTNRYLAPLLSNRSFRGLREEKTLLIGSSRKAVKLKEWLERKSVVGFQTVGLLCDERTPDAELDFPVLGNSDSVDRVLREYGIHQVVLLELPSILEWHAHLLSVCEQHGVRVLILSDLEEKLNHPVIHFVDDGFPFIALRDEPLESPWNRILKRALDLVISSLVIILILPWVTAFVWILQRLQSPGPLLYSQTRAGFQNKPFLIFKFRTMHCNHGDITRQATVDDPRIFPAARWLRKFSIDELPQFLNVWRGEMSVVGPRPHLVEHNTQFAEVMASYHVRSFVKPGITGLAQIRGLRGEAKSKEDIARRAKSDIEYIETWRLTLDLKIIAQTFLEVVAPPQTAY